MSLSSLRRRAASLGAAGAAMVYIGVAVAAEPAPTEAAPAAPAPAASAPEASAAPAASETPAKPPVHNSNIDAALFYQLLIGEIELNAGHAGNAYQILLDAARRTRDEQLFRRATEIALHGRAGEQALAATQAWRVAHPESMQALRLQLQILLSMNRASELGEPLRALLAGTAPAERAELIAGLPRVVARVSDRREAATLLEQVLQPYAAQQGLRADAASAVARAWILAGDRDRAVALAKQAYAQDPAASATLLLALELMPHWPQAEAMVTQALAAPGADPAVRRAYAGALVNAHRYADAIAQLDIVTRDQPELAAPWLTLGALHVELRQPQAAEAALQRFVQLTQARAAARSTSAAASAASGQAGGADNADDAPEDGLTQAWLLLAQAAEQRGDFSAAESWLERIDDPQRALEVQTRRAVLLARQGQLQSARDLIRAMPERNAADARAKLLAEVQVLREVKQWSQAYALLEGANVRFPNDADLLYEQAMLAEKLDRLDAMETLLRRVIELKPDHAHAYNALGYSLADRKLRLDEAKTLIERALQLTPGDPFITDSLGWVEYRLGNRDEALNLLRQAYKTRPDAEIAAHLGEVLWALGRHDEARAVWAEASLRDAGNDVLRETMARLKVQ